MRAAFARVRGDMSRSGKEEGDCERARSNWPRGEVLFRRGGGVTARPNVEPALLHKRGVTAGYVATTAEALGLACAAPDGS
mmetsp:Transcript_45773/g.103133  ORF Transcript_45773/g.103133 Transcript_45773/m.103133 type:complete len:81 (-) Transcript_45773:129-371(-)